MTPSRPALLETQSLTSTIGDHTLLANISVTIQKGDVLAVVGPSGSGKTTLLRLLNRLDEPTSGRILLEGKDFLRIPPQELRRRVGLVLQLPYLFPGTVAENVRYGPRARGEELADGPLAALLEQVGLPGFGSREARQLSVGEAQRVSLARALANGPEVLLLDEPTAPLDEESKAGVESLIEQIVRNEHLTCVVVTHDLAQAARIADRVLVLKSGKTVKIGPISEVLHAGETLF